MENVDRNCPGTVGQKFAAQPIESLYRFAMRSVAFDETGNTGNDLITPDQSVFCLASVLVGDDEIARVAELLHRVKTPEWKFATMRRRPGYLALLREMLEMDWVTRERVKLFVIFKRYMAITKLVDLIHEPNARAFGVDLYEQGGARGLANLLTMTLPVYLGQAGADRLVNTFVRLIRERNEESLDRFRSETESAFQHVDQNFPDTIGWAFVPVLMACQRPDDWLPYLSETELDPLVPSYYTLVDAWGKTLKERFIVLADDSKTLARERELLLNFADESLREAQVGSPTRNMEFPLKVADIVTTSSHHSRAVQVADLLAGIAGYAFTPWANGTKPDEFAGAFRERLAESVWMDGLIPSGDVTPEDLGMEDYVGSNPVDYSTRILARDPTTRK
jgi:hypothetical protein